MSECTFSITVTTMMLGGTNFIMPELLELWSASKGQYASVHLGHAVLEVAGTAGHLTEVLQKVLPSLLQLCSHMHSQPMCSEQHECLCTHSYGSAFWRTPVDQYCLTFYPHILQSTDLCLEKNITHITTEIGRLSFKAWSSLLADTFYFQDVICHLSVMPVIFIWDKCMRTT